MNYTTKAVLVCTDRCYLCMPDVKREQRSPTPTQDERPDNAS